MYVYKKSEPQLWTVGYYAPNGRWEPASDHDREADAGERVFLLNGGSDVAALLTRIKSLEARIEVLEADRIKRLTEAAFGDEIVVYHTNSGEDGVSYEQLEAA